MDCCSWRNLHGLKDDRFRFRRCGSLSTRIDDASSDRQCQKNELLHNYLLSCAPSAMSCRSLRLFLILLIEISSTRLMAELSICIFLIVSSINSTLYFIVAHIPESVSYTLSLMAYYLIRCRMCIVSTTARCVAITRHSTLSSMWSTVISTRRIAMRAKSPSLDESSTANSSRISICLFFILICING